MGAGAEFQEAYFSSQAGILARMATLSVLLTAMMNFAPQSGGCHRIMLVFCDSQMLGFQMHLMQAQLCNYALKGLEDATVMTGRLPACLLMWQSNLSSQQMERALLKGIILSCCFCFFFFWFLFSSEQASAAAELERGCISDPVFPSKSHSVKPLRLFSLIPFHARRMVSGY